jgi:hypothetical protein
MGKVVNMESILCEEELRWQVMKAMIDEFPSLKDKVKVYVEGSHSLE